MQSDIYYDEHTDPNISETCMVGQLYSQCTIAPQPDTIAPDELSGFAINSKTEDNSSLLIARNDKSNEH